MARHSKDVGSGSIYNILSNTCRTPGVKQSLRGVILFSPNAKTFGINRVRIKIYQTVGIHYLYPLRVHFSFYRKDTKKGWI